MVRYGCLSLFIRWYFVFFLLEDEGCKEKKEWRRIGKEIRKVSLKVECEFIFMKGFMVRLVLRLEVIEVFI